jgi:uncharacterized damage-inducible protein DinB
MLLTELENIREHWTRYREVTLQHLELLTDSELAWRPRPELFTAGQQLLHIAQTEDYYSYGLFRNEWDPNRVRFPASLPTQDELRDTFRTVRAATLDHFARLTDASLDGVFRAAGAPHDLPLRWWLWFVLEHEIHHKAQLALYLREMGKMPPFSALPLPDRPDIQVRLELGGV